LHQNRHNIILYMYRFDGGNFSDVFLKFINCDLPCSHSQPFNCIVIYYIVAFIFILFVCCLFQPTVSCYAPSLFGLFGIQTIFSFTQSTSTSRYRMKIYIQVVIDLNSITNSRKRR